MAKPRNPQGLKAVYDGAGDKVILTMKVPTSSPATTQVRIQRWKGATQLYTDLKTVTPAQAVRYEDTDLVDGETYAYRAISINSEGTQATYSLPSNKVTVITTPESPAAITSELVSGRPRSTWANRPTALRPIATNYVFRWDNVTNKTAQVNKIAANATLYDDYSAPADRCLRYRIWAANSVGGAYYMSPLGGLVYTKPLAPTSASAKWSGNDIVLGWANPSKIAKAFQMEHSTDNSTWFPVADLGNVKGWTHKTPERGVPHYYRWRSVSPKPTVGNELYSDWVYKSVAAQTTPNPPEILGPIYAVAGETTKLEILHKPLDGAPMAASQIRHRAKGSTTWSAAVAGNIVPAYISGSIEVQAATRSADTAFGDWSAITTIAVQTRPVVTLNSPLNGAVIQGPLVPVGWSGASQTAYEVQLVEDGNLIETWSGSTSMATYVTVEDAGSYRVGVRTYNGRLWSNWVTADFTTAFVTAEASTLTLVTDPGNLNVTAYAPTAPGAVRTEILRRHGLGDWVSIGFTKGGYLQDPLPPLGVELEYAAVSWTEYNASAMSAIVTTTVEAYVAAVNFGDGLGNVVYVEANVRDLGIEHTRSRALHQFAGRTLPVEILGVSETLAVSVSGALLEGLGSPSEAWQKMLRADGPKWFRDATGNSFLASIESLSINRKHQVEELSFTAEQVEEA